MRDLYPVTITRARYGGVYEGGEWLAFYGDPQYLPHEPFSDDVTCANWWFRYGHHVGKGSTPSEAHVALLAIDTPHEFLPAMLTPPTKEDR